MPPPDLTLGGLQRWLQSVIVHPGTIEAALQSPEAARLVPRRRLDAVVRPSATLTAGERVGVYHAMYLLRMAEALESDYPGLAHFLGEEKWRGLVARYVAAHPSKSHSLNHLGRSLPDWLRHDRQVPGRAFCRDLARLEWAVAEAFDAVESDEKRLAPRDVEALAPSEWRRVRLVPSRALRLVELGSNAADWLDTARGESHDHPSPCRRAAFVVVFRRSYTVYRRTVSRAAFRLLEDLARGRSVGRAVGKALARPAAPSPSVLEAWFRQWAEDGLFGGVERTLGGVERTLGGVERPPRSRRAPVRAASARPGRRARTPDRALSRAAG